MGGSLQKRTGPVYVLDAAIISRCAFKQPTHCLVPAARASEDEERLMIDIFRGYNSLIHPVRNKNDTPVTVKFALQLILMINVVGCLYNFENLNTKSF
jgi:hypothetical protein